MPQTVLDIGVVKKALLLACRAPSVHNSQPWRWVLEGAVLRLFVDPRRWVRSTDRSGREAIISCGAVLDHLRIAMVAAGWQANIDRFPNPNNRDHLASVEFSPLEFVTDAQRKRAEAILQRRTDRLPLGLPTYWASFEPVLRSSIDESIAMLDVLADELRPQLAEASQLTEALRRDDVSYHAELQWWTSPFALAEGVPPDALPSVLERQRVDVARDFPARSNAERRVEVAVDWSKILVLSTAEDSRAEVLGCGEVLSTVLLECTMAGMATCTLTHLIELDESRDIVRGLIGERGEPQVLIRVGIAPPMEELPAATPRRPLDDVLEIY
ncbi:Acg family FMN-binding oxidoreductase [Mycobacterium haemophilum]|uniref:NAD(P)H nitroreductase n=1 Tax=Mycobacterium haemophilum TaxID=29311 RepID=A0A0I9TUS1_9MYCO|nr:NAD(P)H nitroreductase [Mycobacterium haemophilum]KLO33511.1 NAD(P)H nitroreductase [Mycobacterium haemophilum]KLO39037.1 NAD(P)H nitroreductase [Mycobacterium haemophilum]KLO45451.1 NAD(P)H nitroreductase [Mycobacterium haemophilum]KLO56603.1 NAD(P)H nitroreductase [Mycobacterium haemophilum]